MKSLQFTLVALVFCGMLNAQDYYFPERNAPWEQKNPTEYKVNTERLKAAVAFADDFENQLIHQGQSGRSIEETLDRGWQTLSAIPESEYRRINKDLVNRYFSHIMEDGVPSPYY